MTLSTVAPTAADVLNPAQAAAGMVNRLGASIRAALARSNARRQYRQMLAYDEHLLHDIGVTRDEVRQALRDCS
jgi:uncharacterized protein YjiS (DUF1127 family)